MSDSALLTVKGTAKELSVSARTVYRLIKRGELPAVQIGRRWYVPASFFESRCGEVAANV